MVVGAIIIELGFSEEDQAYTTIEKFMKNLLQNLWLVK